MINILTEHAELNAKYGSFFDSQSEYSKLGTETKQIASEKRIEKKNNQSHADRTIQKKYHVNKTDKSENITSGQSEVNTVQTRSNFEREFITDEKMNRENLYHWGGSTREKIEIIRRRRNKSPESRRLVERREALARPGTMRRGHDPRSRRTIFAPSRPNKRSKDEIEERDPELTNRLRGRTGSTGRRRTTSRTKYGRHQKRQRDNAGRQYADRRPQQISHRSQGSPLHANKPHSGKTHRKQKFDGGEHNEGGIQLHARLENTDFQNSF